MREKSKDHLRFIRDTEYFSRDGSMYRSSVSNPVMTDGYRCGRWECYDRDTLKFFEIYG